MGAEAFITWWKRLYPVDNPGNIKDNVNGCIVARFHYCEKLSCVKIFQGTEVRYFIRDHYVKITDLEKISVKK